jgi:hypothetical protein
MPEFKLKLRYSGGEADEHRLEMYDATASFHGFAQALQISMHAYINNEVISRSTALKGGELYVEAPKSGSLLLSIIAVIEANPATSGVLAGMAAAPFYVFIKYTFSKASGYLEARPTTRYVTKLATEHEPFFDDLAEAMEGGLQRAHRPIDKGIPKVTLERPRAVLVKFDKETSAWVNTRDLTNDVFDMDGYVTRYNSMTGNGRAYIRKLKKIIPFRLSPEFPYNKRGYLTWSLHGGTVAQEKSLKFQLMKIESARGEVKRIILVDCNQIDGLERQQAA